MPVLCACPVKSVGTLADIMHDPFFRNRFSKFLLWGIKMGQVRSDPFFLVNYFSSLSVTSWILININTTVKCFRAVITKID